MDSPRSDRSSTLGGKQKRLWPFQVAVSYRAGTVHQRDEDPRREDVLSKKDRLCRSWSLIRGGKNVAATGAGGYSSMGMGALKQSRTTRCLTSQVPRGRYAIEVFLRVECSFRFSRWILMRVFGRFCSYISCKCLSSKRTLSKFSLSLPQQTDAASFASELGKQQLQTFAPSASAYTAKMQPEKATKTVTLFS